MSDKKLKKPKQNYGPGNVLRTKREEYEWSIEAVAEALHLSSYVVKSIEADRYDELPGATYVIGYWRSYARLLGIDLEETIDANKRNLNIVVPETPSLHMANAYHPVQRSGFLIWIGILALLASLVYYSWQQNFYGLFDAGGEDSTEQSEVSVTDDEQTLVGADADADSGVLRKIEKTSFQNQSTNLEAQKSEQNLSTQSSQNNAAIELNVTTPESGLLMQSQQDDSLLDDKSTNVPGVEAETIVDEPPSEVLAQDGLVLSGEVAVKQAEIETADNPDQDSQTSEGTVTEETTVDSEQPKAQTNAITSGNGAILVLSLSKDSWLDIRDKTNKRLVYATEKAGDTIKVNGTPPFYLYIGTPSGVSLKYKGEDVDFETHKSGLFARFKLDKTLEYL